MLVVPDLAREADRVVTELQRERAERIAETEARRLREQEETEQQSFVDYWLAAAMAEATNRIDVARIVAGILLGDGMPGRRHAGPTIDPGPALRVEALRALVDVDLDDVATRVTVLLGQLAMTYRDGSSRLAASRLEPLLPRPVRDFVPWSWIARQEEAQRDAVRQVWAEQAWAAQHGWTGPAASP